MTDRRSLERSRNLVILNQAANYLTVGLANAFNRRFDSVTLITGSIHIQGEELDPTIEVRYINRWHERPAWKKAGSYVIALARMWWLLMTRYRKHEVLFVSVPPMGYLLNLILPHRFSMVIWDIYPDTLKVGGLTESHPVYRLWSWLNRHSFRKAHRLFTISEVMADTLARYVPGEKILVQPIWSIFQENSRVPAERNRFIAEHATGGRFVVQYSGNIGLTHNVDLLIDIAERLRHRADILIQIIGRGPREPGIRRLVVQRGLENVQMLPFQSDDMFPHSLSAADLGVVMLDERVGSGSVPSKAFNLMSFGIPALYVAGADSQLARYAEEFGHARCFRADRVDEIADWIKRLAASPGDLKEMGRRAEQVAKLFRRGNADRFTELYLDSEIPYA